MHYIGIDIGSTAAKVAIMKKSEEQALELVAHFYIPTGWNCRDTADQISERLSDKGIDLSQASIVVTGYGRISVPYAHKVISEISCHGIGGRYLFSDNATIIDIGRTGHQGNHPQKWTSDGLFDERQMLPQALANLLKSWPIAWGFPSTNFAP